MDYTRKEVLVHWFRHGLRLHDNPSLLEGLEGCDEFYPIFIFDGEVAGTKKSGYNRMKFLLECLEDLDNSFKKYDGRLYVFQGQPTEILSGLIDEWGVTRVSFESDPEPVWLPRDTAVKRLLDRKNVKWIEKISHTMWDPHEIIEKNNGTPPLTFEHFNLVTSVIGNPPRPVDFPDFSEIKLPVKSDHDSMYGIPSCQKLGKEQEEKEQSTPLNKWYGGETKALEHLKNRMAIEEDAYKSGFVLPNQYMPDLLGPPLSMSAHLRFGCLSVRKFYWELHEKFKEVQPSISAPMSLCAQLIWREYFYTMSINNIHYDKMLENPICLNIPWYKDDTKLEKWTMGKTGFPWIDAIMNQLRHEGWVHHVARHAVSCFLTRGDLWLSWVDGLEVFYKYLIDADWSVCAGNWMWVSSSAFEKVFQCPNCMCPVRYGKRMDPEGIYVKRYVPVLKDMPLRYLFEPWKAPKAVQEKANCIIGKDYPFPMVEHKAASNECMRNMNSVISALHGKETPHCAPSNDKEVRQFVWLPDHNPSGAKCTANFLCEGIETL